MRASAADVNVKDNWNRAAARIRVEALWPVREEAVGAVVSMGLNGRERALALEYAKRLVVANDGTPEPKALKRLIKLFGKKGI